jgi:hypothetical protein
LPRSDNFCRSGPLNSTSVRACMRVYACMCVSVCASTSESESEGESEGEGKSESKKVREGEKGARGNGAKRAFKNRLDGCGWWRVGEGCEYLYYHG